MKTLLTEKEVYQIHKGDNHSARTAMKIGKISRKGLTWFKCVDKLIFKINKCPHCGSKNSFHARQQSVYTPDNARYYDNVYKTYMTQSDRSSLFQKIDYCLDCHKEFTIEMFLYKKIKLRDYLAGRY